MKLRCSYCGQVFDTDNSLRKYCSNACKRLAINERDRERRQKEKEAEKEDGHNKTISATESGRVIAEDTLVVKRSKAMTELERLAKEAWDHGMSYGQYISKHG